jgi:ADP-ribosyl-[dinitrogen reductase] hydrolase
MLMFLYLELYRKELLSCFTVEPFASQWKALPKSAKEDTAELFRKRLSLAREKFKKQEEEEYAKARAKNDLLDRFRGMFWGLVVGDCLGSPIQFSEKDQHPHITEMVACPIFNTPPGYWTDDASMTFCVADSVVRCGGYDLQDIADTFVRWYREGFWSSLPHAFDVGHATQEAIYAIENGSLSNGFEESQGNGSIMRLAPSYILNYGNPDHAIMHKVSDLTHNSGKVRETVDLMASVLDEHMLGCRTSVKSIYGTREEVDNSGWAVSTLQAALWAFQTTETFEDGMIAAVNLGGDSDTIGAVYGQIAGAYYGFDDIPERWLAAIKDQEKVSELIESFLKVLVK